MSEHRKEEQPEEGKEVENVKTITLTMTTYKDGSFDISNTVSAFNNFELLGIFTLFSNSIISKHNVNVKKSQP